MEHRGTSRALRASLASRALPAGLAALTCFALGACGARSPLPDRDYPAPTLTRRGTEVGKCSWYGPGFHGRKTASGERYDQHGLSVAHRTLPMGALVDVTDLRTERTVRVRVNDRGPYVRDRVCDLSYGAAKRLGMVERGVIDAELRVVAPRYESYPAVAYVVQLGTFGSRDDAERLAERARTRNARAYVDSITRSPTRYRVRVGPYPRRSLAVKAAEELRKRGFRAVIVEDAPRPDEPA